MSRTSENCWREKPRLCPFGHGAGDLLEIGDAPFGTIANQRSAFLKCGRCFRSAACLAQSRHAALLFLPFHFIEIHHLHELTHTANRSKKQVHVIPNLMDGIPTLHSCWHYESLLVPVPIFIQTVFR